MKPTPITTLITAMRILARDVKSGDGVANMAITEAADQMEAMLELIKDCADQFMMTDDEGDIYHSFVSTKEYLCAWLVEFGQLEETKPHHYRWVK